MLSAGLVEYADLDERAIDALREFNEEGALTVLQQFKESDLSHVQVALSCGPAPRWPSSRRAPVSAAAAAAAARGQDASCFMQNKSAFLCGVMKTYRQREKQGSKVQESNKGPDEAKIKVGGVGGVDAVCAASGGAFTCALVSGSAGADRLHPGRHDRPEEVRRPTS